MEKAAKMKPCCSDFESLWNTAYLMQMAFCPFCGHDLQALWQAQFAKK